MDREERIQIACSPGETRETKTKYYDTWSNQYDDDLLENGYRGHIIVADTMALLYPKENRGDVYILDVAAGTGLVGEKLAKQGFSKLDALDASEGMLNEAKSKGVYQNLICSYIDERELDIKENTYDAVVISGGCCNTHLPCACLKEIVRLLRPGGHFVMATRPTHLGTIDEYKGKFEPFMEELEKEGKWRKVKRVIVPLYHGDADGVVFIYQK